MTSAVQTADAVPEQIRKALTQLTEKAGVSAKLADAVEAYYADIARVRESRYVADKEQAQLQEAAARFLTRLQQHVDVEAREAETTAAEQLRAIDEDVARLAVARNRRPGELADDYHGALLKGVAVALQASDQLRLADLDARFAASEDDPAVLTALADAAFESGHTDRIRTVSRVVLQRLSRLVKAEGPGRVGQPSAVAQAHTALSVRLQAWQNNVMQGSADYRRQQARSSVVVATELAKSRAASVAQLVGLKTQWQQRQSAAR